ncbi:MAG: DUF1501 domain-containing protein [Planctomycetota bacterium]|nr:DUF1501 domain-containing protein [Planctomycetota bacterium]
MNHLQDPLAAEINRRAFLGQSVAGLGAFGLTGLLGRESLAQSLLQAGSPGEPRARRVIMIFLSGGLSQFETFDEKPLLAERRGEQIPESVRAGEVTSAITERQGNLAVVGSAFDFARHGECGMNISELFPHVAKHADDLTLVRSLQTDFVLHEAAVTLLFTGSPLVGRPSWGSWVSYALGSANDNLPEFVVMLSGGERLAPLHPRLWHSGYLPGRYQGVPMRSAGDPVLFVNNPAGVDEGARKQVIDAVKQLDAITAEASGDPRVQARIQSYEMAARLQTSVPELADLSKEPKDVLERYGAEPGKKSFAANCLLARRLAERDVRFIQVCDGGWDHHGNLPRALPRKCKTIDQPVGALLTDLKERGLLDDTIVLMLSEFGRAPICEGGLSHNRYGRDHNGRVGSAILAGGGFRKGLTYGVTDDWGWRVAEDPVHIHDLQATVLHQLGQNHERLVVRHQGRDFRLTDVGGRVVHELIES